MDIESDNISSLIVIPVGKVEEIEKSVQRRNGISKKHCEMSQITFCIKLGYFVLKLRLTSYDITKILGSDLFGIQEN